MNAKEEFGPNFVDAERLIREAAKQGAKFIATPENTDRIFMDAKKKVESAPWEYEHPGIPYFSNLAKEA